MSKNIGVLMMVKNEEESIKVSLESTKNYFDTIIILDTGSSDNTINVIQEFCKKNNQKLYLKETSFKSFPESRNDALEFAETVKEIEYLLLMDAGDEFQTDKSKKEFYKIINDIPKNNNYGIVSQKWLHKNDLDIHSDIRFVRNHKNCRYDIKYPVHERFKDATDNIVNLNGIFLLYQNRNKYALSTEKRYKKDIELLLKAEPNKRNLYFLAQSYMSIDDFENGFVYNLKSYDKKENNVTDFDEKFTLVRIGFCAIQTKKSKDIIFKYLNKAIDCIDPPVDAFVYILKYCIDNKIQQEALPYLKKLSKLEKPQTNVTLVNNNFYDYLRWHLISIVTLMCNEELMLGKYACLKAIKFANHPNDLQNINLFQK